MKLKLITLTAVLLFGFGSLKLGSGLNHTDVVVLQQSVSDNGTQQIAVEQLLHRLLPKKLADQFHVQIINTSLETEVAWGGCLIDNYKDGDGIWIRAQTGSQAGYGINYYLRHHLHVFVDWDGTQMDNLPDTLPAVQKQIVLKSATPMQYFGNVCTHSYSFVWWDWSKWELFIDWLALNGFNAPLAHTGLEAVWSRAWLELGLSQSEIDDFFTGPAYLGWNRMGNLKNYGGPLSQHWHQTQMKLQKKIVKRMTDFGMSPVLASFAGVVPDAFKNHYPNANITKVGNWLGFSSNFTGMDFLDPTDPLFVDVSRTILEQTKAAYGLHHLYSADPWNEIKPTSFDHDYLTQVAQNIYSGMQQVDPEAIWVLQGWMFVSDPHDWLEHNTAKTFLQAVPKHKLLILDLYSENTPVYEKLEGYFGQPYVWNMLHNFGGRDEMRGSVSLVNQGFQQALDLSYESENGSYYLVGSGLTMEGIYQNYAIYQFAIDRFWSSKQLDKEKWIEEYATSRYGRRDHKISSMWRKLWSTVYEQPEGSRITNSRPEKQPTLKTTESMKAFNFLFTRPGFHKQYNFWYNTSKLCHAWNVFVQQSDKYRKTEVDLFNHDLVDLTREVLALIGVSVDYKILMRSFMSKDLQGLQNSARTIAELFDDLEVLLHSDRRFMLGPWLQAAQSKASGSSQAERNLFTRDWRNQLTLWGPKGEILDYARKQWSGLMIEYYKPRWMTFILMLGKSIVTAKAFNQSEYDQLIFTFVEQPFTLSDKQLPIKPKGNSIDIVQMLHAKYYKKCLQM